MARRRESLIDVLLILPWWVALTLGLAGYLLLTVVPPLFVTGALYRSLQSVWQLVASIWALIFGLTAIGSAVRSWLVARKYHQQKSLDDIRSLSWQQFECIVGEAFRRRGYSVSENASDGPDGGVDLVLRRDGKRYLVQCKQWKRIRVGLKPVRELFGVVSAARAAGGVFVTSGTYTPDAREFGERCGLELIDGEGLRGMIGDGDGRRPGSGPM